MNRRSERMKHPEKRIRCILRATAGLALLSLFALLLNLPGDLGTLRADEPTAAERTAQDETSGAKESKGETDGWRQAQALYRFECVQDAFEAPAENADDAGKKKKEALACIDPRRLCFPVGMKNGIALYDAASGAPVEASLYEDGAILFPAVPEGRRLHLYFGFPDAEQNPAPAAENADPQTSGPAQRPAAHPKHGKNANQRLTLLQSERNIPMNPSGWRNYEIARLNERFQNYRDHLKPYQPCDGKALCPYRRRVIKSCPNALKPYCARNLLLRTDTNKLPPYFRISPLDRYQISCCRWLLRSDEAYLEFLSGHFVCKENHTKRVLRDYAQRQQRLKEEIAAVQTTDPEDGMEETLFSLLENSNPRSLETGQIFLSKRPFDTGSRFIVFYKGTLHVPESARYTFRVSANSTRLLRIDGKSVLRRFGETPHTEKVGTRSEAELELEKGNHRFELCYQKEKVPTWIAAEWKKTDSKTGFVTLSEEDFVSGNPVRPLALRSRSGASYPLMLRDDKFTICTSKLERCVINSIVPYDRENAAARYTLPERDWDAALSVFLMKDSPDAPPLQVHPAAPGLSPLPLSVYHERQTPRIAIQADLQISAFAPLFLYADESLNLTLELRSRIPLPCKALLEQRSTEKNPSLPDFEKLFDIPRLEQEHADRFASDVFLKHSLTLHGARFLNAPFRADYLLSMPGMEFDRESIAIRSPSQIDTFHFQNGALREPDGTRLIPLLRRPTLHELREWELPKTIVGGFRSTKKLLVAAEDFSEFGAALEKACARADIKLELIPWVPASKSSGAVTLESLETLFHALKKSGADSFLLIPPTQSRRKTISAREELRALAFLIEAARANPKISKIILATPLPSHPRYALEAEENAFCSEIRSMKREYGIAFIDLSAYLKQSLKLRSGDYLPETADAGTGTEFPERRQTEIIAYLLEQL